MGLEEILSGELSEEDRIYAQENATAMYDAIVNLNLRTIGYKTEYLGYVWLSLKQGMKSITDFNSWLMKIRVQVFPTCVRVLPKRGD